MRSSFFYTAGVFIAFAILVQFFLEDPSFKTLEERANFEMESNNPELADITLFEIVQQDPLNIEAHYQYISNHFRIPAEKRKGKYDREYRDDKSIQYYYDLLAESSTADSSDIGHYGNGLIQVNFNNYKAALAVFENVRNKKLMYLNNSIGNAFNKLGNEKSAELHFRKEIANKGNLSGAYSNLIEMLYRQGEKEKVFQLLNDEKVKPFFPSAIEREIYFNQGQPIQYAQVLFKNIFTGFNIFGFIAAFLIMSSWIMYLRKIDVFNVERWRHILGVAVLGMIFSFIVFPLSDFNHALFGFSLNGNVVNDFLYCVIGIGAIEELVKIIPLLLILRYTNIVNEPFDYILYASVSALGFAFVENLIYFTEHNLQIIHGRAMVSVVSHMFDSSIIAYGLILNKYKRRWNPYLNFLFFFALAAIAHGFYDFWLINEYVSDFSMITIVFFLISMFIWGSFKNNALNQSSFYDKNISINNAKLEDYLFYSLAGVLLFEYLALGLKYGPTTANNGFLDSMLSGTYLIFFLSSSLSKFNLKQGEWAPINYWSQKEVIDYEKIVDAQIQLNRFTKNDLTTAFLPDSATVIRALTVSNEPDWYLVKLSETVFTNVHLPDLVAIRTKDKEVQLLKGKKTLVAFYVIPVETDLEKNDLSRTDFVFGGWAQVV